MKSFRLDRSTHRMKISEYLREIQNYSSRSLRRVLVYLDNKQVRLTKKLPSSGTLKVVEKEKETNIKPIKMKLDIVYEDQDLLIINKPYGLVTHPTLKKVDITLANGVVYYLNTVPRFYNRLDMDTTGLIIVAKNSYTQSFLQNYGNVRKKYLAIVEGKLEKETIIEKNIYRPENEIKRIIDEKGQYAKTKVRPIEYNEKRDISLVECELFTGRTHQIRVHLSHIGHPILGDKLYSDKENNDVKRQMLHSYSLEFIHPRTKEKMDITIEAYDDMKKILKKYSKNDSKML